MVGRTRKDPAIARPGVARPRSGPGGRGVQGVESRSRWRAAGEGRGVFAGERGCATRASLARSRAVKPAHGAGVVERSSPARARRRGPQTLLVPGQHSRQSSAALALPWLWFGRVHAQWCPSRCGDQSQQAGPMQRNLTGYRAAESAPRPRCCVRMSGYQDISGQQSPCFDVLFDGGRPAPWLACWVRQKSAVSYLDRTGRGTYFLGLNGERQLRQPSSVPPGEKRSRQW